MYTHTHTRWPNNVRLPQPQMVKGPGKPMPIAHSLTIKNIFLVLITLLSCSVLTLLRLGLCRVLRTLSCHCRSCCCCCCCPCCLCAPSIELDSIVVSHSCSGRVTFDVLVVVVVVSSRDSFIIFVTLCCCQHNGQLCVPMCMSVCVCVGN